MCLTQTDANGHTTTYTYDALNRRITTLDAALDLTQNLYDTGTFSGPIRGINCVQCGATPGSNLVTGQIDPDGTAGVHAGVTFFKYDALDRLVIKVQKVGCIGVACPDNITTNDAITTYTYDPVGNRLTMTEPDNNTTTYQYDADNRLAKETNAAGDVTITAYDGVGNVITVTAPNLNVTTNTYDALDRLTQVTDSIGFVSSYAYDPVGNRLSQTDGNGNTKTYTYDALNRLITTTDALGQTATNQYDPVGNLLKITDRNGNMTSYVYDAINRRISTTDSLGDLTQFFYDPVGNLVKIIDANGHATQYAYDAINRPIQETYADGKMRSFTYDGVRNLLTRTDQIGQVTTYSYNDLYFLLSRAYPSAVNDAFTYDLSGRMLTAQRGGWPVTFTYDGANRVTQTVQNSHTIGYFYDIPGRIRKVTYPGGRAITEHTDARTRLDHTDDAGSPPPIVQYSYDFGNRVTSRTYRNGTVTNYGYNANNWILSLRHSFGATDIAGFGYAYDNEGNKQFEQKSQGALQDTGHSECYGYDNIYRLISYKVGTLVGSCVPVPITQTTYNLDPVGNWLSKTTDMVTQTRAHDVVNELIKIDATNLSYDGDGNLQADATYTYTYDEENRLTRVMRNFDAAVVGQYGYDAIGRRVVKIANPGIGPKAGPTTTLYFYDDARIIEEQNNAGTTRATYVYGNYIDETLTMDRGGNTFYYHQNALWSVEAITDSTANPVERYSYDAYGYVTMTDGSGNLIAQNPWDTPHSAIGNPYLFTGRQIDEETGLYYYRARYYDSVKGRFIQRDPLGYIDGTNLYEYVKSNPGNYSDPFGYVGTCCCQKICVTKEGNAFKNHDAAVGGGADNGWKSGGSLKESTGYGALRFEVRVDVVAETDLDVSKCTIYQGIKGTGTFAETSTVHPNPGHNPDPGGFEAENYAVDTPLEGDDTPGKPNYVKRKRVTDTTGWIEWIDAPRMAGLDARDLPGGLKAKLKMSCTGSDNNTISVEWEEAFKLKANGDTVDFDSKSDSLPAPKGPCHVDP